MNQIACRIVSNSMEFVTKPINCCGCSRDGIRFRGWQRKRQRQRQMEEQTAVAVAETAEQQIEDTRLLGKHLNYGNMSYWAVNCDADPFTFIFRNY